MKKIAYFIDDDQDFLSIIEASISHPHYDIQTQVVESGYRVIDDIIKKKPDILFMDFYLPKVNGSQILPIIRFVRSLYHIPIYVVTGHQKDEIEPFLNNQRGICHGILLKGDCLKEQILKILDEQTQAA